MWKCDKNSFEGSSGSVWFGDRPPFTSSKLAVSCRKHSSGPSGLPWNFYFWGTFLPETVRHRPIEVSLRLVNHNDITVHQLGRTLTKFWSESSWISSFKRWAWALLSVLHAEEPCPPYWLIDTGSSLRHYSSFGMHLVAPERRLSPLCCDQLQSNCIWKLERLAVVGDKMPSGIEFQTVAFTC